MRLGLWLLLFIGISLGPAFGQGSWVYPNANFVGDWAVKLRGSGGTTTNCFLSLSADGTYQGITSAGVERGTFRVDGEHFILRPGSGNVYEVFYSCPDKGTLLFKAPNGAIVATSTRTTKMPLPSAQTRSMASQTQSPHFTGAISLPPLQLPPLRQNSGGTDAPYFGLGSYDSVALEELQWAQQSEQNGQYFAAAERYWHALDLATGGKTVNETDQWYRTSGNVSGIPASVIVRRATTIHVCMDRQYLQIGQLERGLDPNSWKRGYSWVSKDYQLLSMCEPQNGEWEYLGAVNWAAWTISPDYNYLHAYRGLQTALAKKLSPSTRQKCEALKAHITPATLLQLRDMDRAKFERAKWIVKNQENPRITVDQNRVVVSDSRQTIDSWYYPLCKELLSSYPQFSVGFNKSVNHLNSLPNRGIPIPPGISPEVAEFGVPQIEQQAFGPLDFGTGRF